MAKIIATRHKRAWKHKRAKSGVAHKRRSHWPTEDRGKKGKTPKSKRWMQKIKMPKLHKISGYKTDYPEKRRESALVHEIIQRGGGKKGTLSTFRTLNVLKNVNPSKKADRVFKRDANWLGKKYGYKIK